MNVAVADMDKLAKASDVLARIAEFARITSRADFVTERTLRAALDDVALLAERTAVECGGRNG